MVRIPKHPLESSLISITITMKNMFSHNKLTYGVMFICLCIVQIFVL